MRMIEGERTCRNCLKTKPIEQFPKAGVRNGKQVRRGTCKSCHCESSWNGHNRKMIEQRPGDFFQCDDCGKIFHKRFANRGCLKCGSQNIQRGDQE